MNNAEMAEALFAALADGNDTAVRGLCSDELCVRQNNGRPFGLDALLAFNRAVGQIVKAFRYENAVRSATTTGFVEEHAVRGTLPCGTTLDLLVCVVADVCGGRVTHVREYFDSAAAADLIAALGSIAPTEPLPSATSNLS